MILMPLLGDIPELKAMLTSGKSLSADALPS